LQPPGIFGTFVAGQKYRKEYTHITYFIEIACLPGQARQYTLVGRAHPLAGKLEKSWQAVGPELMAAHETS